MTSKKIRILIAEGQGILRWSLSKIFNENKDTLVVGEAQDGEDLVSKYVLLKPDVSLVDISIPKLDGLNALATIKEMRFTEAKFLFLTCYPEGEVINKVKDVGGYGLLDKSVNETELFYAIREVSKGNTYFRGDKTLNGLNQNIMNYNQDEDVWNLLKKCCTKREIIILKLYGQGLTTAQVADKLFICKQTVDFHRSNIMKKMEIESFTKFISLAGSVRNFMRLI